MATIEIHDDQVADYLEEVQGRLLETEAKKDEVESLLANLNKDLLSFEGKISDTIEAHKEVIDQMNLEKTNIELAISQTSDKVAEIDSRIEGLHFALDNPKTE